MAFVENLLIFPAVKEFWKSVKNWQSYCHEFGIILFRTQCTYSDAHTGSSVGHDWRLRLLDCLFVQAWYSTKVLGSIF